MNLLSALDLVAWWLKLKRVWQSGLPLTSWGTCILISLKECALYFFALRHRPHCYCNLHVPQLAILPVSTSPQTRCKPLKGSKGSWLAFAPFGHVPSYNGVPPTFVNLHASYCIYKETGDLISINPALKCLSFPLLDGLSSSTTTLQRLKHYLSDHHSSKNKLVH